MNDGYRFDSKDNIDDNAAKTDAKKMDMRQRSTIFYRRLNDDRVVVRTISVPCDARVKRRWF